MRALLVVGTLCLVTSVARAEPELCARGAPHRGPTLDLDVNAADVHDVYRLLADVGRANIVVAGDVDARVTLRLRAAPWQQVACTIAAVHKLAITVHGDVLLVRRREPR